MQPRISLITLGVADVGRARRFYEDLGFTAASDSNESVTFFDAGGVVLALFGRAALAADAGIADAPVAFAGIALAHNVAAPADVDSAIKAFAVAGGTIIKEPQPTFWGGYAGYAADLDGHVWEVAHNPFWSFDAAGRVVLPGSPT
ncbi:MAG: VOC family protein [Hyphomicrobium sp.]